MKSKNSRPAVMPVRNAPAQTLTIDGANYRLVPDPPSGKAAEVPFTPVVLDGKTYKMCFGMNELCEGETAAIRQGHYDANVLRCFGSFTLRSVREMFACSIWHYHPELTHDEACDVVNLPNGLIVGSIIAREFTKDLPDPAPTTETTPEAA